MLSMIWIMFALSTAHWAVGLAFLVTKVKSPVEVTGTIRALSDLMNAIVTINVRILELCCGTTLTRGNVVRRCRRGSYLESVDLV